jgi:DeoR/GlpR family transcriptional regulator of sugar metabolism
MEGHVASSKGRRSSILQILRENSNVSVAELSKRFGVSEVTIRKDLNLLKERNLLVRTRGGAITSDQGAAENEVSLRFKTLAHYREKRAIGRAAAELIEDGDTIIIDSGTTALQVACNLHKFKNLTVLTNALNVTQEVLSCKRFNVILLGGYIRNSSESVVGALAELNLKMFYCDKLFLGVDSFNLENGISTPSIEEANINQIMIQRSRKVFAVFDSSKVNKRALAYIAGLDQIDAVVTDDGMDKTMRKQLKAMDIKVIAVKPDAV